MSDRDDAEVRDRMAERFQEDEPDESDASDESDENGELSDPVGSSEPSEPSESTQPAERDEPADHSESDETGENDESDGSDLNVKEDWKGRYMYIPPAMHKRFDDEYERLRYECGRDLEWTPKKNKHYYPVVATEGIDAVADMSPSEFVGAVTDLEWFGDSKADLLSE